MRCVCGHSLVDHRPLVMSVPLKGKGFYPCPPWGITVLNKTATYDVQSCWCGCCLFEPDEEGL